jgi:hypothetical protein
MDRGRLRAGVESPGQEETVHITARVPASLARDFERLATREDRSVSAEIRRVMRRHVAENCDGGLRAEGSPA